MTIISQFIFILCLGSISYCTRSDLLEQNSSYHLTKFLPNWKDLDKRLLPQWYDEAKIGIFLHWGVYSVPGFSSEWFWINWKDGNKKIKKFMARHYPPGFTYQEFAPMFKAEFFDPNKWAQLFLKAGARYVILTSKHHDGYTLFPSHRSFSWNSCEIGPKQDIVALLSKAVRDVGLKFGVYHSLFEWFNPIYEEDKKNNFSTSFYTDTKLWPDLIKLITDYKPSVMWADGDWEAHDTYWKSTEFLAWLYNESPVKDEIVVNDRWGIGIPCKHGDFYNCVDRYNPGELQSHKWENAFTVDKKSWGFRKTMNLNDTLTSKEILYQLASTVSCGGNVLINVGPTQHGTIPPIFQERLLSLGEWLKINGEAIYGSSPWLHQNDSFNSEVWYTCRRSTYNSQHPTAKASGDNVLGIFAIFLSWPKSNNLLAMRDVTSYLQTDSYNLQLLGYDAFLNWNIYDGLTNIQLPDKATVVSEDAWVLKITLKQTI